MLIIKQVVLTIFSVIIIFLFFRIKIYNDWFSTVIEDEKKISVALNQFDLETRKTECWGESYIFSKKILNYFRQYQRDKKNALILMPPDKYLIDKNVTFSIPEPAKFYYFTGLKSVRASSPLAEKANYVLVFEEEQFFMVPAENKDTLNNYLTAFRKYEITP